MARLKQMIIWIKEVLKMKPRKQIRNFEKNFSKQTMEEINGIIADHLIPTSMWDSEKYCSMSWKITVDLQTWEDLENGN